jgi:hypothetical protein
MTSVDKPTTTRHGVVQSAAGLVVEQARSLAGLLAAAGSGAVGALPAPVSNTAARLLAGLEQLIEEVPSITDELDVLVDELHAKRLSIKALSAELAALDAQLEVLERSLAPVQSWSHQWASARKALANGLSPSAPS